MGAGHNEGGARSDLRAATRGTGKRRRGLYGAVAAGLVLAACFALSGAIAAPSVTYLVDDTADRVDASIGSNGCRTTANTCSLRAAIQEANAHPGPDVIYILPGTYAIELAPVNENAANVGDFELLDPVRIEKAPGYLGDVIIDGGNPLPGSNVTSRGVDRLFEIHPGAGDVTLRNLTLQNGYSPEEGGAIQNWSLGKLTLDGVTVKDSYADKAGGGLNHADINDYEWTTEPENLMLLPYGRVEIKNSTFTGNGTGDGGAAINNVSGGTITISDSLITLNPGPIKPDPHDPEEFVLVDPSDYPIGASAISNQARWEGVGTIKITNSTVSLNASEDPGAGISSWGDSVVTISGNSRLTQNRSSSDGGGLFSEGGSVSISGSGDVKPEISKNQAANGAGLYFGGHPTVYGLRGRFEVKNAIVSENRAESGGGIYNDGEAHLFVTDTVLTKNHSADHGAAITSEGRSNMTLTRVSVVENESWGEGGGVWTHSERQQTIVDSTFAKNKAGVPHIEDGMLTDDVAGGGGLHTSGGPVTIAGTTLEANEATEEGGGISMHNHDDVVVRDSVLRNNRAYDGGGVENSATRVTFERMTVQGNRAGGAGGGIHNTSSGEFKIIDSTIRENVGVIGGGLANAPDNHLIVRGSLFLNNSARVALNDEGVIDEEAGHGGGLMSFADGDTLFENTTFSGNKAAIAGGGLFHDADGELRLVHVTVWNNSAPAGGAIGVRESDFVPPIPPAANSAVVVKNSIVGGSVRGGNCDWYVRSEGGNLETGEKNTCFLAVTAATAESPIELGVRDRRGDAQLWAIADNGGATMTHALQWGSLAIDSSMLPCSIVDQRGVSRPQNGKCDAGAFEFVGLPPVFDDMPPETEFVPGVDGPHQDSIETMGWKFRGTDNLTASHELQFECRLIEIDLAEQQDPVAPWDPIPPEFMWNGCSSPWSTILLEEGLMTFEVRAIDRAGNVDPTPVSYLLSAEDIVPADTVILEKPPLQTNSRSALFSFTAISDFTPAQFMEYECRLDSRDPEMWLECFNPMMYSNLSTGLHTFEVRAVSEVGGFEGDPTPARYTWRIGPDPSDPSDASLNCDEANITLTPTADGWADQVTPLEGYIFETELTVRSDATDPGSGQPIVPENARAFFRFNVQNDAPSCELESATLRLYSSGHTENRILEAAPLGETWKESTLTWVSQPDPVPGVVPATTQSGELYREWDVKAHVEAILAGDLPSHGWVIRDQHESDTVEGGEQSFISREQPQDPPEITLPELELRFQAAADAPGPPPRDETLVNKAVQCGEIITESTRLTADVEGCLGEGIGIGAPNIILDLNGHTVTGGLVLEPGEEDVLTPGIRISYPNVLVRNGAVTNFGYGVLLGPSSAHSVVEGMTLFKNALAGVHLFDADNGRTGVTVRGNRIDSNGETGIQLMSGTEGSTIENNFLVSNGMSIHLFAANRNVIRNNDVSGLILDPLLDSDAGIVLENSSRGNLLEGNDVSDTGDAGIVIHQGSHGNVVRGGVLVRNGDAGVIVEESDRIEIDDVVSHQQSDGGVVLSNSSGSSVKSSDLRYNPSGVSASNTNGLIVDGNDASHSLQAGIELGNGVGMQVTNNVVKLAGGSGISLEGGAFDANGVAHGGSLIADNTTNENDADGIAVADNAKHTLARNTANNNAGYGIAAGGEPALPGEPADPNANIDGGGNRASGNHADLPTAPGQPGMLQCLGVLCETGDALPLTPADLQAPDTSIVSGPLGPPPVSPDASTGNETAVFEFTANDGPNGTATSAMIYECRLDAPPDAVEPVDPELEPPDPTDPELPEPPEGEFWIECVSPFTYPMLEPGEHRFEVRAVDWAGNFDLTPAVYTWRIHAGVDDVGQNEFPPVSPDTRIAAAPGELITDEAGTRYDTTNRAATLRFTGSDNLTAGYNLQYECRLHYAEFDDSLTPAEMPAEAVLPFEPCSAPLQLPNLEYGGHIFEVRSVDLAGNKDVTPAWHSWWIHPPPPDVTPPETTISSGPDLMTVSRNATFEFAGSDNQSPLEELVYECRLDGAMLDGAPHWTSCSSPHSLTVSSPAVTTEHVLQVRAVDLSGNRDDVNGTVDDALPDGVPAAFVWSVGPAPVPKTVFCGQKVTQSIIVNNSLGDCLGHGLIVGANNITIDLNGKTIDGKSLGAAILNNGFDSVTVKNGRLTDFDYGVMLNQGSKLNIVEGVTADLNQDAGIGLGQQTWPEDPNLAPSVPVAGFQSGVDGTIVRGNTLVANKNGVWLMNGAKDNVVRGNLIGSTSGEAVWVDRAHENHIEGNDIEVASKHGILLEGAEDNVIRDNSITAAGTGVVVGATTSGTVGIESTGNLLEGNLFTDTAGPAVEIESSSGNQIVDNVATLSDSYAIELYLGHDNVIRGNEVSGNKGGISLKGSTGNLIEGNDASDSDSSGIELSSQSFSNIVRANHSNDNVGGGIYIGDETPAGQGTLVEGNTTNGNKGMGIQATKPSHIFKDNVAFDNESWGIYVGDPSNGRASIDGGGNLAQGNKGPNGIDLKPQQCYNVRCEGGPGGGDQIAPNTSLLETPIDPSPESVAVFRFTGADNASPVTYECRFESTVESAWEFCASPKTYDALVNGEYTFEVRARDFSGNVDPTPETYTWHVALGAFAASIDATPEKVTVDTSATFEFSANRSSGVSFQCVLQPAGGAVDWASAAACASPKTYTGLEPGHHEFWVRGTDEASNYSTKMYAWTIGPPPVAAEVNCGQILTQSTRVLNDLVDCGGYGLIVGAPGITIDLDGHVIDGLGLDAGILNNGHDDVTILNGMVAQFLYGVQLNPGTARNVVHSLRLEANEEAAVALSDADQGPDGNTIRDNAIVGNEIGIALYSGTRHAVIRDNMLAANRGEGSILLEFVSHNLIEHNQIGQSGAVGISMLGGGHNTVSENTLKNNFGFGIFAGDDLLASNDNLIQRNTILDGAGGILVAGDGNSVLNNKVTGTTGPGVSIELATNTLVKGNDFTGNASGVSVSESSDTLVESNNASGTTGAGIAIEELTTDTIVRNNTTSGNSGDGIEVADSSVLEGGALIEGNTADANGGDGILVEGAGHTIKGNVAQLNGGWGIYSVGGIDGGSNFAAGNMEPEQCFGVECELGQVPGAPDTWIVSGPKDVDTSTPGIQSNSRNASFTYMGADDFNAITEIVFECRIDTTSPTAWEDCEYPAEFFNLSPGEHTLDVRAIDMLGQGLADPTPATFTWAYVPLPFGVAPEVTIDHKPPAETYLPEAIFTFHSNEPDVAFQCKVDLNGWQPCGFEGAAEMNLGAFEWELLEHEVGPHTFYVRAIDFEGNVGEPTTYTWSLLGITVLITDGPGFVPPTGGPEGEPATGGPTQSTSAEIHFEAVPDPGDVTFWCRFDSLDPADFFPCESPFRVGPAHSGNTSFPEPLLMGDHMLEVFAESETMPSAAELETAEYEWEVVDPIDTLPPDTSIERAPGPADLSSTIFEFTGIDDLTPPFLLTFECQVTNGDAQPNELEWELCTSPFNLLDLYGYGDPQLLLTEHTFWVRAVDMYEPEFPDPTRPEFDGNPDPTPATHTWTPVADTRGPGVTITAGPAEGATVGEEVLPYEFVGSDNATPLLRLEFECAAFLTAAGIGSAEWESCSSPVGGGYDISGLEPGAYTVAVRAVDLAGNVGQPATRAVTIAAEPVVSILTGPNGRIHPVTGEPSLPLADSEHAVFTYTADQAGVTFECSLDGADFLPCNAQSGTVEDVYVHAFWVVESGEHEFAVRATNAQGLVGLESLYEWMVELGPDTVAPNTTIMSGPQNGTLLQVATFTFTGLDNRTPTADLSFECALDSTTSWSSCTSPEGFSDLTRGSHTLRVRAVDAAGIADASPAAYTWTVAPPPVVTITSGPGVEQEETASRTATFEFTSDVPGVTFHCWLDGKFAPSQPGNPTQPAPCAPGVTYENLGLGEHLFAVRAVDGFGNIGIWEDAEFRVTPPEARITSAPASGTTTTATFEFTSEPLDPNAEFYCALDDRPFGLCESPKTYTNLWPGEHTFQVQTVYTGLDWAGEPVEFDPVPARHTWTVTDFTAPETLIDFGPPATTVSTSAYLQVSSDDPTATVECTLAGPAGTEQVDCEPAVVTELTDLVPGSYAFSAVATDPSLNVDSSPATHAWTIGTPEGPPNTPAGDNVVVSLPQMNGTGNATVTFFSVETAGFTTVDWLGGGGPSLPEGYGGAGATYDISTTALFSEPVTVCLTYDPDAYGTTAIRLLHFDGEVWLDITTMNNPFSSPARVCGEAESFSLFAVASASFGMMPETSILSGPTGPLGPEGLPTSTSGSATFEFWADQPGAATQCSIDGEPYVYCESPFTVGPLEAGEHEFLVQAINEFGWMDLTPAIYEWEVIGPDTTPPSTVITKGPPEGSSTPNFISWFEFSGSDDFTPLLELEFECTLDGEDLGGCETPEEIEAETPGQHTLVVRAVDAAGNVDPVGATRRWTIVDMSAPDTEILTGPEEETTETTATFTFDGFEEISDLPVEQFECALDEGDFAPCTSPHTITGLAGGSHVFLVRAVDPDGNVDISPDFYEWLITAASDTTPPDTFIAFSPPAGNSGPDVTFAFASDEQVETYECSWGAGTPPAVPTTWEECEPVWFLEGLPSGQHWLWVRALDLAQPPNVDPTPAPGTEPFVWITNGEPETFITSGPENPTGEFNARFVFESDQANATFQCSVDGSPWTPCTSSDEEPYLAGPFLPDENGAPTEHEFEVRAVNEFRDANGEQVMDLEPAIYEWTVQDDTPPETEFLGATPIGPEQFLEPGLRFSFRGDDDWASSFELTFECGLDNTADADPAVWEECSEPGANDSFLYELAYADLEAGPYTFQVRALDVAENVDPTPAPVPAYEFLVEAEPETTFGAASPDMGELLQTDATTLSFTFTGTGVSFECALDSLTFTPCSSPVTYTDVPYGEHLFQVQAVAEFGTRDLSPAEFSFQSGYLTPPDVTITSTPAVPTESTTATFTYESSDPDASFLCTLDGLGTFPCPDEGITYTGLLAGEQNLHTFEVEATKANLLVEGEPATFEWTITDATAPDTMMLAPLPANPSGPDVEIRFAGTDDGTIPAELTFECRLDGVEPWESCSSPYQLSALTGGQHTLEVRAIDRVPLTDASPATFTWDVIAPPATQITVFPAEVSDSTQATFEFFDQPGSTYECRLDPVEDPVPTPFEACTSPTTYDNLTNGPHVFEVRATTPPLDGIATTEEPPASYEWDIDAPDAIAPETTIDLSRANGASTASTSARFLFSGTDNLTAPAELTYECSLDGVLESCEGSALYTDLPLGEHTFTVAATDPQGNVDATPASRTWTVVEAAANTAVGTGVEVDLGGGATATFETVTGAGVTTLELLSGTGSLLAPYSGAGAIFLDVSTTAAFTGDVEVCLPYDTGSLDEPHLLHFDGEWVDVTTELDAAAGIVCGLVSSLSPFGVAAAPGLSPATELFRTTEDPVLETEPGLAEVLFAFDSSDPLATFECSLDGADWGSCDTPYLVDALVGEHTLRTRAVNEGGTAFDLTPAVNTFTVLARPVATIELGPEDQAPEDPDIQNESRTATFWFSSDQPPSSFECRLTGESTGTAWEACTSPTTYNDLALEEYTFEVQAINGAGHASLIPAHLDWEVADLTRPNTTIHSGPDDPTSSTSATFVFSADEPATFECFLDGLLSTCTSGFTLTNLEPGSHTFEVLASDLSERENVELVSAVWTWTVDTQAPGVTLLETPPATDTATSATFEFSAGDNHSSPSSLELQCRLDGQPADWESCASPKSYDDLLPGDHTFEVRAVDEAGNAGGTSYSWEILDTIDPETEITAVEPGSVIIYFSGSDDTSSSDGLTFECSLDDAAFSACTSPKVYENTELSVGEHTFEVRAVDEAGNLDTSPDSYTWTVLDTTAPETTITDQPESSTAEADATFSFTGSDDATAAAGLAYECSLDGAAFAACTSPTPYSGLAVGSHTFRVRAADEAGNDDPSPASYSWTVVDVAAPETTITARPDASTGATGASFSFTGSDNGTAAASLTFQCALDGAEFSTCTSPQPYSGLAVGSHTFRVQATDAAGNVDSSPASYTWTVLDTIAPETAVTAQPPASTGSTSASFEFTGSDDVTSDASLTFECSLDGAAFADCTSPRSYSGLAVGSHTFRVRASDAAGNTDASPAGYTWTVLDTAAPETTITGQPAASTTSTTATFTFAGSDETTAAASLTFQCSLNGAPFVACTSPRTYTGVPAGPHTFRVRATDAAGNADATPASYSWTVLDSTAPVTTITGQPVATTTSTSATFSFTGGDDLTAPGNLTFECALDAGAFGSCTSPRSYSGLAVAAHTFRVRATDAAGNTDATPAEYTWQIDPPADTTAPETTITAEPPATTQLTTASFSFTSSETPASFECSLDSAAFAACTSPKSYSGLAVGQHTFRVRAADAAGNVDATPASTAWTVSPPSIDCGPQQTLTASADAWIDQGSASSNKGSDSILKVMSKSGSNLRGLVRFNLPALPQGCSVESATLRLYAPSSRTGRTIQVLQLAGTWTEGGVTWGNQPATAGTAMTTPSGTGWREWGVAGLVQAMYTGGNNGFLVRDATEGQDAEQQFHSREKGSDAPQLVLKLGNGAPPPTGGSGAAPETSITGSPLAATSSSSATFTFTGVDDATPAGSLTFQCQLDVPETSSWTACTSPRALSGLAQGAHTFRVRAVDGAGNADASPAVYTWTVDQTAPETVISNGPGASTTSTSASFSFTASEAGVTFQCALDAAAFAACASPASYSNLAAGSHTFQVRAVDAAGNVDATPAPYPWTIQSGGGSVNCGSAQAQAAVADSWLDQGSASSNKGSDSILKLMSKGSTNLRALVRFNLPAIPAGCVLDAATLRVYAGSASSSQRTLQVFRLNGSWTESGVTWANQPATTGSPVTTTSGTGYRQWNVASIVSAMYSSGSNNGFLLRDATEGQDAEQQFFAREKGESPPQLVLTFKPAP